MDHSLKEALIIGTTLSLVGCTEMEDGVAAANNDPSEGEEATATTTEALTSFTVASANNFLFVLQASGGNLVRSSSARFRQWNQRSVTLAVYYPATVTVAIQAREGWGDWTNVTLCSGGSSGTWCMISATEANVSRQYRGIVYGTATASSEIDLTWGYLGSVGLTANPYTSQLGVNTAIIATYPVDVGPSPYYLKVFDLTTGGSIVTCSSGTSCSASVSYGSTATHQLGAYLTTQNAALPVTGLPLNQQAYAEATWASTGFQVSLSRGSDGFVATTNRDVNSTPYHITIYKPGSTVPVTTCSRGTSCLSNPACGGELIAFVSKLGNTYPPPETQANSSRISNLCMY